MDIFQQFCTKNKNINMFFPHFSSLHKRYDLLREILLPLFFRYLALGESVGFQPPGVSLWVMAALRCRRLPVCLLFPLMSVLESELLHPNSSFCRRWTCLYWSQVCACARAGTRAWEKKMFAQGASLSLPSFPLFSIFFFNNAVLWEETTGGEEQMWRVK